MNNRSIGTNEQIFGENGEVFYKKTLKHPLLEPPYSSYFEDEISLMNSLQHPCLVKPVISEFDKEKGYTFTTPKIENGSLADLLKGSNNKFFTLNNKMIILMSIAHTMAYLHRNCILHGNLHPNNVLIDKSWITRIVDYGLNTFVSKSPAQEDAENGRATPYMSNELVRGTVFNENIDVYAFGTIMYEIVYGQRPYNHANPYSIALYIGGNFILPFPNNKLGKHFEEIIKKCWGPMPKRPTFDMIVSQLFQICQTISIMGVDMNFMQNIINYFNSSQKDAIRPDIPGKYHFMKFAAYGGNARAMIDFANVYMDGKLFPQNYEKALYYMRYAAEKGNTLACQNLAKFLEEGRFVEQDFIEAYDLYETASKDKNCGYSGYKFATFLVNGIGGLKDTYRGFAVCKKAAEESKDADAINYLGELYECGIGTQANSTQALKEYQKAFEMGNPKATYNLARIKELSRAKLDDVIMLYEKASNMGQPDAMNRLGELILMGVVKNQPNKDRALGLFSEASAKNHAKAKYNFALLLFEMGQNSVAIDYMKEAGKCGCIEAQQYLSQH